MTKSSPIFLIAMPQLLDPNFEKSVVLIFNHSPDGALGIVVNKTTEINTGDFAHLQNMDCHPDLENLPIIRGGPVEPDRCWVLHANDSLEEKQEIVPGLHLSGTTDSLKYLLQQGTKPLRIVVGYAGWAPGQLENEMAQGAWLTSPINKKYILETKPTYVWRDVLQDMGVDPSKLVMGGGIH